MKFLAHRGLWSNKEEQNTFFAFSKAFEHGFGIELDIRDHDGELVISHDPPRAGSKKLELFLDEFKEFIGSEWLALNIKSDGLSQDVSTLFSEERIKKAFVFDMSIPDLLSYKKRNIPYLARYSEYEPITDVYRSAIGVWVDHFLEDVDVDKLLQFLDLNLIVCIVSPELHGRNYFDFWRKLREIYSRLNPTHKDKIFLCTDFPLDAEIYFVGNKS